MLSLFEHVEKNGDLHNMKRRNNTGFRGRVKDGTIIVWTSTGLNDRFEMRFEIDQIDRMLSVYGNSHWVVYSIVRQEYNDATERWIEGTKDAKVQAWRRNAWENDPNVGKGSALHEHGVTDVCCVVREQYKVANGHYPQSWFEFATSRRNVGDK